jgi:hypothetical protein
MAPRRDYHLRLHCSGVNRNRRGLPDRERWGKGRGVGRRFDREAAAMSNIVLLFYLQSKQFGALR